MLSLLPHKIRLLLRTLLPLLLFAGYAPAQSITQSGLRSINGQGRFRSLKADAAGNLYTLLDAGDGIRVVKMDSTATSILAETHLGQTGDQALALALDSAGSVYVTGTSLSSGSVTGTAGTAFPARSDSTTNSFLAKFTPALAEQWLTFLGSGRMAVTAVDATTTQAVVTGSIFTGTLPVTPNGIQHLAEMSHEFISEQGESIIGHGYEKFTGYITALGLFILLSNMAGLVPGLESPTADVTVPLGLALVTFFYYQYQGVRANGFGYIKQFNEVWGNSQGSYIIQK